MKNLLVVLTLNSALLMPVGAAQSETAYSPVTKAPMQLAATGLYSPKLKPDVVVKMTVQPQPTVADFQDCNVIAASGYSGSVIAQQTVASLQSDDRRLALNPAGLAQGLRRTVAELRENIGLPVPTRQTFANALTPDVLAAGAPGVTPPPMQHPPETTNPRTPWPRVRAKNPYRCTIGSVSVSITTAYGNTLRAGDQVQLLVTSYVVGGGYYSLWIEDTYRLTAQSSGPLNFSKIVVAAANVGNDPNATYQNTLKAVRQLPNGAFVGFQMALSGQPGDRLVCNYKPRANGLGAGSISCPVGAPWPLQK